MKQMLPLLWNLQIISKQVSVARKRHGSELSSELQANISVGSWLQGEPRMTLDVKLYTGEKVTTDA
jgi:hypothetical protein